MKVIEKICGVIAILAPFWLYIVQQLWERMNFDSDLYILICISTVVVCIIALIISVVLEMKGINNTDISVKGKKLVGRAFGLGILLFGIMYIWLKKI